MCLPDHVIIVTRFHHPVVMGHYWSAPVGVGLGHFLSHANSPPAAFSTAEIRLSRRERGVSRAGAAAPPSRDPRPFATASSPSSSSSYAVAWLRWEPRLVFCGRSFGSRRGSVVTHISAMNSATARSLISASALAPHRHSTSACGAPSTLARTAALPDLAWFNTSQSVPFCVSGIAGKDETHLLEITLPGQLFEERVQGGRC
jgi:hypothetical protein